MVSRVGFMGVQCDTPNLGLAALAYAAIGIVHDLVPGEAEIVLFSINSDAELDRMAESLGIANKRFIAAPFYRKKPASLVDSVRQMRQCDVILDFTGGDSFSDIYGIKRLVRKLGDKEVALASGVPLVLAPQTIGPFESRLTMPWVKHVVKRAALVFTRDELSRDLLARLTKREVVVTTDVAVTLPWTPDLYDFPETDRPRVGLNVSGLLWKGGHTGRNQFNLVTDYREYCHAVIEGLLAEGAQVHLVPHVLGRGQAGDEDDVVTSRFLIDHYPECVLSPPFRSPVEAKSYISRMDVMIGSRMHATIASLTSGVPTVPVAYSRKFAGFFRSLGYPVLVDLQAMDTSPAIEATLGHVRRRAELVDAVTAANVQAKDRIALFTTPLAALLERRLA